MGLAGLWYRVEQLAVPPREDSRSDTQKQEAEEGAPSEPGKSELAASEEPDGSEPSPVVSPSAREAPPVRKEKASAVNSTVPAPPPMEREQPNPPALEEEVFTGQARVIFQSGGGYLLMPDGTQVEMAAVSPGSYPVAWAANGESPSLLSRPITIPAQPEVEIKCGFDTCRVVD